MIDALIIILSQSTRAELTDLTLLYIDLTFESKNYVETVYFCIPDFHIVDLRRLFSRDAIYLSWLDGSSQSKGMNVADGESSK